MECFDLNCEREFLHGDNAWFNENLGMKQNVNKRLVYWSLPDIMVLDIKRFEFNETTFSYVKNQTAIRIPVENVDLSFRLNETKPIHVRHNMVADRSCILI